MQSPCKRVKNADESEPPASIPQPQGWEVIIAVQGKTKVKQHPTMTRGSGGNQTTKTPYLIPILVWSIPGILLWDENSRQGQVVTWEN